MLPNVIAESIISRFKYWDDTVKEGMFFQNQFYTLTSQFDSQKRLLAYHTGCEIAGRGIKVCITVAESGYILWQELSSGLFSPSTSQNH